MPRYSRLLGDLTPPPSKSPSGDPDRGDLVIILAVLLCALICVLGLVAVARCAWIRRLYDRASGRPNSGPPAAANKGLKKKILGTLPVFAFAAAEHAGKFVDCAICLTEFAAGDKIRVMPQCGHGYHVGCIDTWLGSHSSCPSCRQLLVTVRCEKCGAKDSPATSSAAGSELQRAVTNHVNSFFLP